MKKKGTWAVQFSRHLLDRRRELRLTQQEVADRAGIHRTLLSDYERDSALDGGRPRACSGFSPETNVAMLEGVDFPWRATGRVVGKHVRVLVHLRPERDRKSVV